MLQFLQLIVINTQSSSVLSPTFLGQCYFENPLRRNKLELVDGGILAFLHDHMLAECCALMDTRSRAVTADLQLSFVRPISPNLPTPSMYGWLRCKKVRMSGIVSFVEPELGK